MAYSVSLVGTGIHVINLDDTTEQYLVNPGNVELSIDGDNLGLLSPESRRFIQLGPYSNIRKSDSTTPTSLSDAITYLSGFIYFKQGGGGTVDGAGITRFFNSVSDRDTYFNGVDSDGNPRYGDLSTNFLIAVNIDGIVRFQEWNGASPPTSYDAALWNETAFHATTIETEPASLNLGNLSVSSANHALGAENLQTGQHALGLHQRYSNTGTEPAFAYSFGARIEHDRQLLFSENQPTRPYAYAYTMPVGSIVFWTGLKLRPSEAGVFNFVMRTVDANGQLITRQDTHVFSSSDVGNEVTVELKGGFLLLENETVHVTLLGARLFGGTVSGTWFPYFKSLEQVVTYKQILVSGDQIEGNMAIHGDLNNPENNDWRFRQQGNQMHLERYRGTNWQSISSFGSFETDQVVLTDKFSELGYFIDTTKTHIYNLVKPSALGEGVVINEMNGRLSLASNGTAFYGYPITANEDHAFQSDGTSTTTGTSFEYTDRLDVDSSIDEIIFWSNTAGVIVNAYAINQDSDIIAMHSKQEDYEDGTGTTTVVGENRLPLRSDLPYAASRDLTIRITSMTAIEVQSNSSNEPKITLERKQVADVNLHKLFTDFAYAGTITNPTFVAYHSTNSDITFGGFATTGQIRKRVISTGVDTFFSSTVSTPVTDSTTWADWTNRETLTFA